MRRWGQGTGVRWGESVTGKGRGGKEHVKFKATKTGEPETPSSYPQFISTWE